MKSYLKSTSLTDSGVDEVLAACRAVLEKRHLSTDEVDTFLERTQGVLTYYRQHMGEGAEFEYLVLNHLSRVELRLILWGENYNLKAYEYEIADRTFKRAYGPLVRYRSSTVSHVYASGRNIVSVVSPRIESRSIIRSPTLQAAILGLACGLLCLQLPDGIREGIVNDIAKPVQSLLTGIVAGVAVPVTFLSMIIAISAMRSIDELTGLGFKTVGRFVKVTLAVMVVGIAVSLFFYSVMGDGGVSFQFSQVVDLVLNMIPTNVLSPFLDGNVPQIVVLAIGLGAALLMLENRAAGLRELLIQLNEWFLSFMDIVMAIIPAIPFVSIFAIVAEGSAAKLLNGVEFIVAAYLAVIICGAAKLVLVSRKYQVSIKTLWAKIGPLVRTAFATGNEASILKQEYEVSKNQLGIKPEYTSFWIPMRNAMLYPAGTLLFVIPSFFILKYTNTPISIPFLVVLVILALQLSIAGPGVTGGWIILFGALGFSPDFVGMFLTYRLALENFYSGYSVLQAELEQIEGAYGADSIDLERLRAN